MAFLRRAIDVANREIQFEISDSCNSVNLKFNPEFIDVNSVFVRVEMVSKNTANQVLYAGYLLDLKLLFKFAYLQWDNMLPFAIGKNLSLNDDIRLLVTLNFPENQVVPPSYGSVGEPLELPTSFQYELNTVIGETNNPLVIKKVDVNEELTFSTEFYPLLLLSSNAESYETVVMVKDKSGNDVPKKLFYGSKFIKSQLQYDAFYLPIVTAAEQKVTVKGTSTSYLILVQP